MTRVRAYRQFHPAGAVFGAACLLLVVWASPRAADSVPTAHEMNSRLMDFADTYLEGLGEVIDRVISDGVDERARYGYHGVKVFYVSAAIDIVTGTQSINQLIDMLILLRLQRQIWEQGGFPYSSREHAERIRLRLADLEQQLTTLALQVLSREEIDGIHTLAEQWKQDHPDRNYVAFVRFQDFADSDLKNRLKDTINRRGLFSSIDDAKREIEDARLTAERALFLANHMPLLLEWQAELFVFRTLATGEVLGLQARADEFSTTAGRLAGLLDSLPEDIGAEIQKLVEHNDATLGGLISDLLQASENLKQVAAAFGPLLARNGEQAGTTPDLQHIQSVIADFREATAQLAAIMETFNGMHYDRNSIDHFAAVLDDQRQALDTMITGQSYRLGLIGAGLIILFFTCLAVALRVIHRNPG